MKSGRITFLATLWLYTVATLLAGLVIAYLFLHLRFVTPGYFWLYKGWLMAEVGSWSLAGALIQILLSLANKTNKEALSIRDVFIHLLQITTAPFLAMLLFAALYYWNEEDVVDKAFIILSFIAGLLSGHLRLLFRRNEYAQEQFAVASLQDSISVLSYEETNTETEVQYGLLSYGTVIVNLVLDDAGLFFDEKKELTRIGFENASVSLQMKGGDVINAVKIGAGRNLSYIADDVEHGVYVVRAMQSVRLEDNSMLNLFGEKEVRMNDEEINITLPLGKLDS